MQQLSGQDASFIYTERSHAPTHITSIGIYDQSTAPNGVVTFKGILEQLEHRLHLARAFRQKLVRVPGDLDHPWWVEDAEFDLEYHVRHIALPKPGDWRQFCIQTARLHARPLDLSRPLWELYVVEGLDHVEGVPPGAFGVVLKVHHAAVDGKSGVEMITAMQSQAPDEAPPPPPDVPWQPEQDPSSWQLSSRAWANAFTVPGRSARLAGKLVPGLGRAARLQRGQDGASLGIAPATRFNGPVTPHRVIDACFFQFADLKPMRNTVPGSTVNDVALAILGGALRQYLSDAGELPEAPLRAMTPVSVRTEAEKGDLGNQVSAMVVSLATNVADPVERLAAVHASTKSSKELTAAVGARTLTDLSQLAPGALIGLGSRLSGQFARRGLTRAVNTVVTNVPGPRQPLYFAGAELIRSYGAGPVVDGMGLINIVTSYEKQFVLSFTGDRGMMPDPGHYADCIRASFDALGSAT
jgi:diacylglycerol O-acyltransferase / wax synthase